MDRHELFEKFISFLFDNNVTLKPFFKENDILPDKRRELIKKFLNSKIEVECGYCDRGHCTGIQYDPFHNPKRVRMQKVCIACNGTGKKLTSISSIIELRQSVV